MKKLLSVLLALTLILTVFSVGAFAGSIVDTSATVLYYMQDGDDIVKQENYNDDTAFVFVTGSENSSCVMEEFTHPTFLIINNSLVEYTGNNLYDIGELSISGSGRFYINNQDNKVTVSNENTLEYTGNINDIGSITEFYSQNDYIPVYTYGSDAVISSFPLIPPEEALNKLVATGDLTVDGILNVCNVEVTGDLYIKAPEEGDPNGINIRNYGHGGSITVCGEFYADEGQMLLIDDGVEPSDYVKSLLCVDNNGEIEEYDINSQFGTKTFQYNSKLQKFVFSGVEAGNDELFDYDFRVIYNQDKSKLTFKAGEDDYLHLHDGERALFADLNSENPTIMPVELTLDLTRNFEDREIPQNERIENPQISIILRTFSGEEDKLIVENGIAIEEYSFDGNTLVFTPKDERPFEIIICLTEEEFIYETYSVNENEFLIEYIVNGSGSAFLENGENSVSIANKTKAAVKSSQDSAVFSLSIDGDDLTEINFNGRFYALQDLPCDGIYYDEQENIITLPLNPFDNFYFAEFVFGNPFDDRRPEFQVIYDQNKFDVHFGDMIMFDHQRAEYPNDSSNPVLDITEKDGSTFSGIIVFKDVDGETQVYLETNLDNGRYTIESEDIYCLKICAEDEMSLEEYCVGYDASQVTVKSGENVINPDEIQKFAIGEAIVLTTENGLAPYKIIMEKGTDERIDVTEFYSNSVFTYIPEDTLYRKFNFYMTKQEYEFYNLTPDPEHIAVQFNVRGNGEIEVTDMSDNQLPSDIIKQYGNQIKILLPNENNTLKIKLIPDITAHIDAVIIEGDKQPEKAYADSIFVLEIQKDSVFINAEFEFGDNEFMTGDANGDGKVDSKDLVRLKKKLAGQEVEIFAGADVNGDGNVNSKDLVRLKKHLAGSAV